MATPAMYQTKRKCIVTHCSTLHCMQCLSGTKSHHRVPKNTSVREQWMSLCGREDLFTCTEGRKKLNDYYVCSNHFCKSQYSPCGFRLMTNSAPKLKLDASFESCSHEYNISTATPGCTETVKGTKLAAMAKVCIKEEAHEPIEFNPEFVHTYLKSEEEDEPASDTNPLEEGLQSNVEQPLDIEQTRTIVETLEASDGSEGGALQLLRSFTLDTSIRGPLGAKLSCLNTYGRTLQHLTIQPPKKHSCTECSYTAATVTLLTRHKESVHMMLKSHKCPDCKYTTSRQDTLARHRKFVHMGLKLHKCEECNQLFSLLANLDRHKKSVHLGLKPHKCSDCDYATGRMAYLLAHIKSVHFGLKPHKCQDCDYTTNQPHNLEAHINAVHLRLKPHKCPECSYSTVTLSAVRKHRQTVHLGQRPHQCPQCKFTAARQDTIDAHRKSFHLGLKIYKCTECNYAAGRIVQLDRHVNSVHLRLRPFKCSGCEYRSAYKQKLKDHSKCCKFCPTVRVKEESLET